MDQQKKEITSEEKNEGTNETKPTVGQSTVLDDEKQQLSIDYGNEDDAEEEIVTMEDVLKEEEELQSDVLAVLGGSDDSHCTYPMVPRQPLYACNTCEMNIDPISGEKYLAGFCLACSYHCHEGHEVFELYTKRNFRCDCGNEKFANASCKLLEKTGLNEENKYNHNFVGIYCTCDRPYPDPEDTISDEMIQCGLCEDWFHGRHLGVGKSAQTNFTEMVCYICVKKYSFLVYYKEDDIFKEDETDSTTQNELSNETEQLERLCKLEQCKKNYELKHKTLDVDESKLKTLFLCSTWRSLLCKCTQCLTMYDNLGIDFITSLDDMVYHYEQKSTQNKANSNEDEDLAALKRLNHVQQIEYIKGYQEFRTELSGFLETFATNKRVVRPEDVKKFFEEMKARKRPRFNMPYLCSN